MSIEAGQKLQTIEAARYLGLGKSTLDKFRCDGIGPRYLKMGRRIVYERADLDEWARKQRAGEQQVPNQPSKRPTTPNMSLRDWFAGQALAGLAASDDGRVSPERYALGAYAVADAMLAHRAKGAQP